MSHTELMTLFWLILGVFVSIIVLIEFYINWRKK